ncbi:hypothetical protein OROHE_004665 [Orobanche hederae]
MFSVGPLPQNKLEFTVVLADASPSMGVGADSPIADGSPGESDRKRSRRQPYSQTYKVAINFAAKIPLQAIANALCGQDSEHFQEAVRVFDITLRQNVVQKGCLLARQSFFHNEPRNFVNLGWWCSCRGFHSSCSATQGAKRMLRNLRIKDANTNLEYKIAGLRDLRCKEQTVSLRQGRGWSSDVQEINVTFCDYFVIHHNIRLKYSRDYPCINIGKPKRPIYIPIELCSLVSLQCYTKASYQISSKSA